MIQDGLCCCCSWPGMVVFFLVISANLSAFVRTRGEKRGKQPQGAGRERWGGGRRRRRSSYSRASRRQRATLGLDPSRCKSARAAPHHLRARRVHHDVTCPYRSLLEAWLSAGGAPSPPAPSITIPHRYRYRYLDLNLGLDLGLDPRATPLPFTLLLPVLPPSLTPSLTPVGALLRVHMCCCSSSPHPCLPRRSSP